MSTRSSARATHLLRRWSEGDRRAAEELLPLVYEELHALASGHMAREASGHTLQPTALIHEAWLRIAGVEEASFASRNHFYALVSQMMRRTLVDHARRRNAEKRGGERERVALEVVGAATGSGELDVLELHEALERLTEIDEELGRLVELRFFGSLSVDDAAGELGLSPRTGARRWRAASAWLMKELSGPD